MCVRERVRDWRRANPEKHLSNNRAWRRANLEKARASSRNYARTHRIENLAAARERGREMGRTPKGRFVSMKSKAKQRGIAFRLNFDEWRSLVIGASCHYGAISGESCTMPTAGGGLDRKDSSGAYEPSNVVPCCKFHNGHKKDQPYDSYVAKLIARRERAA